MRLTHNVNLRKAGALAWSIQGLLAALFLFAGGMKLGLPLEMLKGPVALPGLFLRFIGVCEVLGAIGFILPGLTRIGTGLTPLAASGLVIIMIGAEVVTLAGGVAAPALVPAVVGLLAASVAYGGGASSHCARRRSAHRFSITVDACAEPRTK